MNDLMIFTDGSCLKNPGQGGYAAIIVYDEGEKILSGGFRLTTNNRMELLAVIIALKELNTYKGHISIYTDSRLITDTINKGWLKNWKRKNWIKSDRKPVLNRDLWEELDKVMINIDVSFIWVKAHAGDHYNERCDVLAKDVAGSNNLPPDFNYENVNPHSGLFTIDFEAETKPSIERVIYEKKLKLDLKIKVIEDNIGKTLILEKGGNKITIFANYLTDLIKELQEIEKMNN